MDAKSRKVFNCLTKLGGEQEVFDISIEVKMTEDAVQTLLGKLSDEGLVSCRRDAGGKEFWGAAEAKPAPADAEAKESAPSGAAGKKKGKAMAAGPDDRFDEFIVDSKAAPIFSATSPAPSPAPIPPEPVAFDSFEPAPAGVVPEASADFEPKPPKVEKRPKGGVDDDFEPKPEKVKTAKKRTPAPDGASSESKSAKEIRAERELSAGPDDRFDEFAERIPSKPNLPIPLMAGAAMLVLIVILFIVGGSGGKTKKIQTAVENAKTELTGRLDSLATATAADIKKLRAENRALRDEINGLKADLRKAANQGQDAAKKAADKAKQGGKKK